MKCNEDGMPRLVIRLIHIIKSTVTDRSCTVSTWKRSRVYENYERTRKNLFSAISFKNDTCKLDLKYAKYNEETTGVCESVCVCVCVCGTEITKF